MIRSLILIFGAVALAAGGQLSLKTGMSQVGRIGEESFNQVISIIGRVISTPMVWIGLVLYGLAAVLWLIVLSRENLSFAYPIFGSTYLIIVFLSWVVLREEVSLLRWLGASFIALGVFLVARSH